MFLEDLPQSLSTPFPPVSLHSDPRSPILLPQRNVIMYKWRSYGVETLLACITGTVDQELLLMFGV